MAPLKRDELFGDLTAGLDQLRTGFAVFDVQDTLVYCNEHFRYLYLSIRDLNDIVGMQFKEILELLIEGGEFAGAEVINDPEGWLTKRLNVHKSERAVTMERLSDGRWIEVKERRIPDGGVIAVLTDVTESRRYLAHLESALECVADGVAIWDQAGRLFRFNDKFSERYSTNDRALEVGDRFGDVVGAIARSGELETNASAEEWLSEMLARRHLPERSADIKFTDEQYYILSERRTSEGGMVSALTDVTELKRKERDLIFRGQSLELAVSDLEMVNDSLERQGSELAGMAEQIDAAHTELKIQRHALAISEARQRAILETMADALVVLDARGYVENMNRNAEQMLGVEPGEAYGRALVEFVQIEDEDQLVGDIPAYLSALHEEGGDGHQEFVIRTRSGSSLYVEVAISEAKAEEDRYLVITLRDISERKAAEKALYDSHETLERRVLERTQTLTGEIKQREQTEKALMAAKKEAEIANWAKSQFLANMSHELRTPLNCVIGFSDMLKQQYFGPIGDERYIEYASDISMSGNHLLSVIGDILDVSKIELGELELEESVFDITKMIDACVIMTADRAKNGDIALRVDTPENLPKFFGDERRVKQALLNLVSNAIKFTKPTGQVLIECLVGDRGDISLIVVDTGIGISQHDIERVLKPFAQVADSHTRGYEGTGLGLSIAKSLTELHNGTLEIESVVEVGTRVALTFPAVRTVPQENPEK